MGDGRHPRGDGSPITDHRSPALAYATNCYSGESVEELLAAVRSEVAAVRKHLGGSEPVGVSLRIGIEQAGQLSARPEIVDKLRGALEEAGARVVGANAFPISAPVDGVYKDGIYRPDWREEARLEATLRIARAVAELAGEGRRVVLSTLAGTCRLWPDAESAEAEEACAANLRRCAEGLERISAETGRDVVLALEPEPYTTAETVSEALAWFGEGLYSGPAEEVARRRLGVNLDLSHCAVMFEDPAESMRAFARAGIPLFGLHVSAALRSGDPAGQRDLLRAFDEPKYLHQVTAVDAARDVVFRSPDLGEFLELPAGRLAEMAEARVHFHVPVFAEAVGGLATTADVTWEAVRAARSGKLTDLFVVETYTWPQVAGRDGAAPDVAGGIAEELRRTREALDL
jgi:sugar phosphate isomerase/epimerase